MRLRPPARSLPQELGCAKNHGCGGTLQSADGPQPWQHARFLRLNDLPSPKISWRRGRACVPQACASGQEPAQLLLRVGFPAAARRLPQPSASAHVIQLLQDVHCCTCHRAQQPISTCVQLWVGSSAIHRPLSFKHQTSTFHVRADQKPRTNQNPYCESGSAQGRAHKPRAVEVCRKPAVSTTTSRVRRADKYPAARNSVH